MSMEVVFPFLREEREREIKKELDLLRRLLTVMERDERRLSLKLVEEERMKRERMICKEIARLAEMEVGRI